MRISTHLGVRYLFSSKLFLKRDGPMSPGARQVLSEGDCNRSHLQLRVTLCFLWPSICSVRYSYW